MLDLSIVIVSWNVKDLLRQCLRSVISSQNSVVRQSRDLTTDYWLLTTEIIVVDNGSTDGSAAMVREEFPQVRLMANEANVGFTKANNQALAQCRGRTLLLLNPDTEVRPGALEAMVAYMDEHPEVGALGPQLLNPDGSVQSSRRRFPTLTTAFLESTVLQLWFPDNAVLRRYYVLDRPDDEVQEVDWVVGAAILIRREAWDQVGPLDEGFFMYSEELDWCRRARERGWRVVYLPAAQVVHYGAQSSEQVKPLQHIHFQRSKVRYFRKHHGPWQAEALRLFLLATYAYQLIEEGLKWLVGHKRPLRAARVKAYWQVLKSKLV